MEANMDISMFLKSIDLEMYLETFLSEHIDMDALQDVTDQHLREMGVSIGHRIKLKKALEDIPKKGKLRSPSEPKNSDAMDDKKLNPSPPNRGPSFFKRILGNDSRELPSLSPRDKTTGFPSDLKDVSFKILVVGNGSTGKTSLIARYTEGTYFGNTKTTVGDRLDDLKIQRWDKGCQLNLLLWDIAGQDRFANMTRVYYRDAHAAFVVFDIGSEPTFKGAVAWKDDIDSKVRLADGSKIPVVLLANKCDISNFMEGFSTEQMDSFCIDHGFSAWFKTSAKNNIGMESAVDFLVDTIFDTIASIQANKTKGSSFHLDKVPKKDPNCCT